MIEKKKRGFALLSYEERSAIARRGGIRAHELGRAHRFTADEASRAGKKGAESKRKKEKENESLPR